MRTYRVLLSGEPILLVEREPDFGRFEAIKNSYLKPAPEVGPIRATVLPDIGKTTAREIQHITIVNSLDSHFVGDDRIPRLESTRSSRSTSSGSRFGSKAIRVSSGC